MRWSDYEYAYEPEVWEYAISYQCAECGYDLPANEDFGNFCSLECLESAMEREDDDGEDNDDEGGDVLDLPLVEYLSA